MKRITREEAKELFKLSLYELGERADSLRRRLHPEGIVTFIIDRNINYTNICINRCKFCAFWRSPGDPEAYVLSIDEILKKVDETVRQGGTQILIQGGLHPELDIDFYVKMLRAIKVNFNINIHGFSPPEIWYLADKHHLTIRETLFILKDAGLDSIPGGGAEILSDRIREMVSPKKIKSSQWLRVMEEAHRIGMKTTATMMFGSIEEQDDIIEHLDSIRTLQDRTGGFTAFIPWTYQPGNTELGGKKASAVEYLKVLSISRLYLDNIKNIQASWVTQGMEIAQLALRFGANDFGSTMLEENVVSSTGHRVAIDNPQKLIERIVNSIKAVGFIPCQRDTYYNIVRRW
ncbi:MAG: cyclic dehypoxanthinyl futalosine synthase [Thermodesulfovibrionales bacterium]